MLLTSKKNINKPQLNKVIQKKKKNKKNKSLNDTNEWSILEKDNEEEQVILLDEKEEQQQRKDNVIEETDPLALPNLPQANIVQTPVSNFSTPSKINLSRRTPNKSIEKKILTSSLNKSKITLKKNTLIRSSIPKFLNTSGENETPIILSRELLTPKEVETEKKELRKTSLTTKMTREMFRNIVTTPNKSNNTNIITPKNTKTLLSSSRNSCDSLSATVDLLNLLINTDIEDDEDAYETLQLAIGASDEDMKELKTLAGKIINTEYVYDNQNATSNRELFSSAESTGLMLQYRHAQIDHDFEHTTMVCPALDCLKQFYGLIPLQMHVSLYHKTANLKYRKTPNVPINLETEKRRFVCFVCKELFVKSVDRDEHIEERHKIDDKINILNKQTLLKKFIEILENTLIRCIVRKEQSMSENNVVRMTYNEFIVKLKQSDDGLRAYEILKKLKSDGFMFTQYIIIKLNKILGKSLSTTPLPRANKMIISSKQQHNMFNSDSRPRQYVCPICRCRFLTGKTRNKHFAKQHPRHTLVGEQLEYKLSDAFELTRETNYNLKPNLESKYIVLNEVNIMKLKNNSYIQSEDEDLFMDAQETIDPLDNDIEVVTEDEGQESEIFESVNESHISLVNQSSLMEQVQEREFTDDLDEISKNVELIVKENNAKRASAGGINKNKCIECNQIFINSSDYYHHRRLIHEVNLVSKLESMKRKANDLDSSSTQNISPIKPVNIANSELNISGVKELEVLKPYSKIDTNKSIRNTIVDNFRMKLKNLTGRLTGQSTGPPVTTSTPVNPKFLSQEEMKKLSIQASLAKLKMIPRSELSVTPIKRLPEKITTSTTGTPKETPKENSAEKLRIKPGPKVNSGQIFLDEEIIKQKALDLINDLNIRKPKGTKRKGDRQGEDGEEEYEVENDDDVEVVDNEGSLLTNKQQYRRVVEVVDHWNSSDEDEGNEEETSQRRSPRKKTPTKMKNTPTKK